MPFERGATQLSTTVGATGVDTVLLRFSASPVSGHGSGSFPLDLLKLPRSLSEMTQSPGINSN